MSLLRLLGCAFALTLTLTTARADPLPSVWTALDIGPTVLPGSSGYVAASSTFTLRAAGADIYGPADAFHFLYRPVTGDFTFTARILSADGPSANTGASSGLMLRETLAPDSPQQLLYLEPRGYSRTTLRLAAGAPSTRTGLGPLAFPCWLRLQRCGEQISLATSADGVTWTASPGHVMRALPATVFIGLAATSHNPSAPNTATFDHVSLTPLVITTPTSWLGNTYPGGGRYVQNRAQAIAVDPATGHLFLNGQSESCSSTFYDTQGNFLAYASRSHFNGSNAVVWDPVGRCVWLGQAPFNKSTGKGGIAAYTLDGTFIGSVLNTPRSGRTIVGLAVHGDELYAVDLADASDPADTARVTVHVVSLRTRAETRSFLVPALARNLAADPAGNLWIVFTGDATRSPVVRRYTPAGAPLPPEITGLGDPQGITIDASGRLYIADSGPAQRIEIYDRSGARTGSFGDLHGIYSGIPGRVSPSKLDFPAGVAVDAAGNLYVACNGPGNQWSGGGSGLVLRKYSSTATASAATLRWERLGLEYVDSAAPDPATDAADVYTKYHHYTLDYTRPPGQGWTYRGQTLDPFTYPDDPRLKTARAGVTLLNLGSSKFLVDSDQHGGQLNFYRLSTGSEIAVPCVSFIRETARGKPSNALSLWIDKNADGRIDPGETDLSGQPLGSPSSETYTWDVDSSGDVWTVGGGNNTLGGVRQPTLIWRFRHALGPDGSLSYSSSRYDTFPLPPEFAGPRSYALRLHYVPATDTLYIAGYTAALPRPDNRWGLCGRELLRYDHWTGRSAPRTLAWRLPLPYSPADGARSLAIADDLIAAVCWGSHAVTLYDAGTGRLLDRLQPGPEVNGSSGNIDTHPALAIHRRADGEYLIFTEEDNEHKILFYRWHRPPPASAGP